MRSVLARRNSTSRTVGGLVEIDPREGRHKAARTAVLFSLGCLEHGAEDGAQTGRNGFSIGARQRAEPLRISCIQGGDLRRAHDRWGGETSGARMPAATVSGVSEATSPMLITPKITVLSPRPSRVLRSRLGWAASIEKTSPRAAAHLKKLPVVSAGEKISIVGHERGGVDRQCARGLHGIRQP